MGRTHTTMAVITSHKSDEWGTPQDIFDGLNEEFNFTLDACATDENHKVDQYYTKEENGLEHSWGGQRVWCNPPYSEIDKWVEKAFRETRHDNTLVVMLIPSRTDTKYFHDFIYQRTEIRFVRGRLKFVSKDQLNSNAPFPNMIVIFRGARVSAL